MAIITLLTDFNTRDEYVSVVKGVIYGIDPKAVVVDISHHIGPQDIIQAAYLLKATLPYFPDGSIHVTVVDPGVGSGRAILASRQAGRLALAPDNGLLRPLWEKFPPDMVIRIENTKFFRHPVSRTFHGRDIFAPVSAHLSRGVSLAELGPLVRPESTVNLRMPKPFLSAPGILRGEIVWIDSFGNLITNIEVAHLEKLVEVGNSKEIEVQGDGFRIVGLSASYSEVFAGQGLALIGSRDCLEIAVSQGSAAAAFALAPGAAVYVRWLTTDSRPSAKA